MTKSNKLITFILVVCLLSLTALMDMKARTAEKKLIVIEAKLDSTQRACDSLLDELLYYELMMSRYETGYQILLRKNPKAAEQYGNIISEETE